MRLIISGVGKGVVGNRTGARTDLTIDPEKKLQIDLTPRALVQLLYTVKRANLRKSPPDQLGSEASIFNLELQIGYILEPLSCPGELN
jgi:hypothetical protein